MTEAEDPQRVVTLTELRCPGRHGAYAGEQDQMRDFIVDVRVTSVDGAPRPPDPERVSQIARRAVASASRKLLERVAYDVAASELAGIEVAEQVWVRVTKPEPPGLDADAEAVSLTLARDQLLAARRSSARRARSRERRAPE